VAHFETPIRARLALPLAEMGKREGDQKKKGEGPSRNRLLPAGLDSVSHNREGGEKGEKKKTHRKKKGGGGRRRPKPRLRSSALSTSLGLGPWKGGGKKASQKKKKGEGEVGTGRSRLSSRSPALPRGRKGRERRGESQKGKKRGIQKATSLS